jgi:hypothetical protein
MSTWLAKPVLSRKRILFAFAVAVLTDVIQFLLGPFGWTFADEIMDVIAMILISLTLGFHPLLLPTFVVEIVPIVDMFPTWTVCTAVLVAMRRRERQAPPADPTVIDVEATPVPPRPQAEPRRISRDHTAAQGNS